MRRMNSLMMPRAERPVKDLVVRVEVSVAARIFSFHEGCVAASLVTTAQIPSPFNADAAKEPNL